MNISDKTGSRLWKIIIINVWSFWTRKCAVKIFKISQLVLEILTKKQFSQLFWNFLTKQEVDFSILYILQIITTIEHENLPLEFLKYLTYFSSTWQITGFLRLFWIFLTKQEVDFFKLIYFTIHYYRTWKFAFRILKISQLVLELFAKKRFSVAILHFPHETGSRFIEPIFFTKHYYWTLIFAIKNSEMS